MNRENMYISIGFLIVMAVIGLCAFSILSTPPMTDILERRGPYSYAGVNDPGGEVNTVGDSSQEDPIKECLDYFNAELSTMVEIIGELRIRIKKLEEAYALCIKRRSSPARSATV